ncbi:unnamed protein product [Urochloa humidicola]
MDLLADQIESLAGGALHGGRGDVRDLTGVLPVVVPPSPISSLAKNCWLLSADEKEQDKQEDEGPAEPALTRVDVNKICLCCDEASMVDEAIEYLKQLQLQF